MAGSMQKIQYPGQIVEGRRKRGCVSVLGGAKDRRDEDENDESAKLEWRSQMNAQRVK